MAYKTSMFNNVISSYVDTDEQNLLVDEYWKKIDYIEIDHNLSSSELEDLKRCFTLTTDLAFISYNKVVTFDQIIEINKALKDASSDRVNNNQLAVNQVIDRRLSKNDEQKLLELKTLNDDLVVIKTPDLVKGAHLDQFKKYVEIKNELLKTFTEAELTPLEQYVGLYESIIENYNCSDVNNKSNENNNKEKDILEVSKNKTGNDQGLNSLLNGYVQGLGFDSRVIEKNNEYSLYVMMDDKKYGVKKMLQSDVTTDIVIKNKYNMERSHFACDIDSELYVIVLDEYKRKMVNHLEKNPNINKNILDIVNINKEDKSVNQYDEAIRLFENALINDDESSLVHARLVVDDYSVKKTCMYTLEVVDNKTKKPDIKDTRMFEYNDDLKENFINPMNNVFLKDGYVTTSNVLNNNKGATYLAQNHKDNVLSVSNIEPKYANEISNKATKTNKEISLGEKPFESTLSNNRVLAKTYQPFAGFVNVLIVSGIVGFVLGAILAIVIQ